MKRTLFNLLFLAVCGMATAQTLSVDDVQVLPGTTASYVLKINVGDGAYSGFQYQMQFPSTGFALTKTTTVLNEWQGASFSVGDLDASGKANASAYSGADKEIPSGDIIVGSVEFSVDASVALGEYDVTISGFDFLDGTNYYPANGGANVTFKVIVTDRITLDENSTVAPVAQNGVNVKVKRTIKANEWSTICLPFAMTEIQVKTAFGSDVELGDFNGYVFDEEAGTITVNFTDATAIEANHPYIIKVSSKVEEFTVDGVDIDPEDEPMINKGTSRKPKAIIGSYVANTVIGNGCLFLSGNHFWYSVGNTKMKAFRAYFDFFDLLPDFEDNYAESRISMKFADDETTGIGNVKSEATANDRYYNLSGQRVEKPAKGIYVKEGKKIVVK